MRSDLELSKVLQQIAIAITTCTGFAAVAISLIDNEGKTLRVEACAGVPEEERQVLYDNPFSVEALMRVMRPQFRQSQSFFIPHQYAYLLTESNIINMRSGEKERTERGQWDPEDSLVVPLYSLRNQKLLGCLTLDDPTSGKIPTIEQIEVIELFAHQAVVAVDNSWTVREQQEEEQALEEAITFLCEDLQVLRQGDLQQRMRSTYKKLRPLADLINQLVDDLTGFFQEIQTTISGIEDYTRHLQDQALHAARKMQQRDKELVSASESIKEIKEFMGGISERTALLSKTALEAVEVTFEAQGTMDRAVEGMSQVREATMQSASSMKTLGESGQEINETSLAMTDLTTRLHLLALNAAIEATRSRGQGHSFTIIAQEMRTLAGLCADVTRKVNSYIHTIQQEATHVSSNIEDNTQQVVQQTELVTQASVSLEAISILTEQLTRLVQGIGAVAENQLKDSITAMQAIDALFENRLEVTKNIERSIGVIDGLIEGIQKLNTRIALLHFRTQ